MQGNIININTPDEWQKNVVQSTVPVIVDFYADWCPPCQKLSPVLEQGAQQSQGKWILAKINVDNTDMNGIVEQYASDGIPAVYLFENANPTDEFLGYNQEKAEQMMSAASK